MSATGEVRMFDGQQVRGLECHAHRHRNGYTDRRADQAASGGQLGDGTFMLTWGDGVSDVHPLDELLGFHRSHGKLATMTAVRPPARFGTSGTRR